MATLKKNAELPAMIIHGGAGGRAPAGDRPRRRRAIMAALELGLAPLLEGGNALEAVVAATVAMEDDPLFNAGYGSALNSEGRVEMDACVMVAPGTSSDPLPGGAGAVAAVSRVRNPILLARAVMERTPHLLMVGAGAEALASRLGLELCRPEELITDRARARWLRHSQESLERVSAAQSEFDPGTVGAVAIDSRGRLAAATSTGGLTGKLPGRVGDSAIPGAGTHADAAGAASATGIGEAIMVALMCHQAVALLGRNLPSRAAHMIVERLERTARPKSPLRSPRAEAGIILVDRHGRVGFAHNAQAMEIAYFTPGSGIQHRLL